LIFIIIGLEIAFLGSNVGFVLAATAIDDIAGYIFSLIALTLAGGEVSLGLAIIIIIYRKFGNIYSNQLQHLKG
jgi:NADH-quinone oxidoreductase subunit K